MSYVHFLQLGPASSKFHPKFMAFSDILGTSSRPSSAKRLLQYLISAAKHVDRRTQSGHPRAPKGTQGHSGCVMVPVRRHSCKPVVTCNVNPALVNHGLLPDSHNLIVKWTTPPVKQPKSLSTQWEIAKLEDVREQESTSCLCCPVLMAAHPHVCWVTTK